MLTLTESATEEIRSLIEERDEEDLALRVIVAGQRAGQFVYQLGFIPPEGRDENDVVVPVDGFDVIVDDKSAEKLEGATMDYVETPLQKGFKIDNPNPVWDDPTAQAIQELLDEEINPGLGMHGGFVSLVEVKDDTAFIAFGGGCQGCGMVDVTLKQGIEGKIKEAVPGVTNIVDTTDHAEGENPYYQ